MYPAEGHTADGAAYWLPWAKALVCGDYLSPVEIPMLSPGGSLPAYRQTLARMAGLIMQAEWVIPGHGAPYATGRAMSILEQDDAYLDQLAHDPSAATLPSGRATAAQRQIHAANVAAVTRG
jgi:glyoxylase-like metal-dependent hydrolase (beta-lactamase superfamily II)